MTKYDAFKSYKAQVKALTGPFFLMLGFGGAITSLVISGSCSPCTLTDNLCYACVILGSVQSSLFLGPFGHKACMLLSNAQCMLGQLAALTGGHLVVPYAGTVMLGLGVGSAVGPCIAYAGDACEPKYRNALVASMHLLTNWWHVAYSAAAFYETAASRRKAFACLAAASSTLSAISFVCTVHLTPDSPMWLLTKGKTGKAWRTLHKLRGYSVRSKEFRDMFEFTKADFGGGRVFGSWTKLLHPKPLRPYLLMFFHFMLTNVCLNILRGGPSSCHACGFQFWNWNILLAIVLVDFLTSTLCAAFDKSNLILSSSSMCTIGFVFYGLCPYFSSDVLARDLIATLFGVAVPLLSTVLDAIGWMLVTEIFTAKCRNVACCVYPAIHLIISLYGNRKFLIDFLPVTLTSESLGVLGTTISLYMSIYYFCNLPKTHKKTLQQISKRFKEKQDIKYDSSVKNIFIVGD